MALSEETASAWEDLAERLRDLGHDVRREDRYMEPGRYGVVFGEVLAIYIGMKALDVVTDHAMEAALKRVIETVKAWGRERFGKRRDAARPRPISIAFLDENGRVIKSWKIDQEGEQEQTGPNEDENADRPPVEQLQPAPAGWDEIPTGSREPQVLLLLRSTHKGAHIRADAFVAGKHRLVSDLTRLPAQLVVSPTPGRAIVFRVDENDSEAGVELKADGFRCELIDAGEDTVPFLCYEEELA